ncbi:hypothetical protein [Emticicia agri]|uniref:Copper resistance protein NlpE n=1 Tax=Emticicia agri TaxID=2492393 RepID=A0A4Q5M2W5_9BACT|nr:hypothetical protein [Emticicia agri]RYU96638.1 hypothetical protein EWM59_05670 [Emticicia agri]
MKNYFKPVIVSSVCLLLTTVNLFAQDAKPLATYVGTSPCGNILKPFLGIANEPDCDFTKWTLTLYQPKADRPAMVKLVYQYGVSRPNTSGFKDEKRAEFEGHWTIQKGTKTKPNAMVYQVTIHTLDKNLLFLKLSDNVIHLLDSQRGLMIGNSGYSYTLSKQKP